MIIEACMHACIHETMNKNQQDNRQQVTLIRILAQLAVTTQQDGVNENDRYMTDKVQLTTYSVHQSARLHLMVAKVCIPSLLLLHKIVNDDYSRGYAKVPARDDNIMASPEESHCKCIALQEYHPC
jgi:hypothetical protein